jgi:hypothetical protein
MDRFLIPSLLRWVGIPVAVAILASTVKSFNARPWGLLVLLLGESFLVGWTVMLLASTIRAAFRHNWKRAALLPCAFVCSLPLIFVGVLSGDYIHLAVMYPYYVVKIHSQPDWRTKEVRFDWGDEAVTVLDGLRARVLIYDASGKTVVGDRPDLGSAGIRVNMQHLIGNFYLEFWSSD